MVLRLQGLERAKAQPVTEARVRRLIDEAGGGGGGLSDGVYGDVTVSGGGTVITINSGAVSASEVAALSEAIDDRVAALLVAGTNVTLTYDDVANTLTIASAGGGFPTVAALVVDTSLTYASVTAGDYVRTEREGFSYEVAASGATDHHLTTAGGLKLYVVPANGEYPIEAFVGTDKARVEQFIGIANTSGGKCALIFDAAKTYSIASTVSATVTAANVRFDGRGAKITVTSGDIFRFGDGTAYPEGGIVENFDVVGASIDATSRFVRLNYGGRFTLRNIICNGVATLFDGGGLAAGKANSAVTIENVVGRCHNLASCPVIRRGTTFAMTVRDVRVFVDYAGIGYALAGRNFLDDNDGEGRSTLMVSDTLAERFYRGINILTTNCTAVDFIFSDVVLDSCYETPFHVEGGTNGVVASMISTNLWATGLVSALYDGASARFKATASGSSVVFCRTVNGWFNGGDVYGLTIEGNVGGAHWSGCFFGTYETPPANKVAVALQNTAGLMYDIAITGCQISTMAQGVPKADYGIFIDGTANIPGLRITDNTIGANLTHLFSAFSSPDATRIIQRNSFLGPAVDLAGSDIANPLFTTTSAGFTPASGGGTANFLRADGSWAAPPSGGGGPVAWGDVTGKPATFPPDAHSQAASTISDSTTPGRALLTAATAAAQRTLLNVADGSTANASDASLRDRATHTGLQLAATISDFASAVAALITGKQDTLVSATNIKTVNGNSLLGSGDLAVSGGSGSSPATAWVI